MGQCVSGDEDCKYSLNVLKQALKIFKDKVDSQMINLQSVQKGPKRQLKRIQALKAMIRSLEKQVGNFYQHFKQQKCPPNFIYSINTMNSLLDDIWKDHNSSLSTVEKLQQRVDFWLNAAKNVKESHESIKNNTQFGGPQTDTKQNNSYNIDKMAEIDALNIKIDALNTIIKKNQQISVEKQARFKKEQQNLIQQNTKQLNDIKELSFQLALANSQLTNKTNISQKQNQYERRIAAHEVKLAELQKGIKEKALKEDLLNRKIQTIEAEKNTLLKRIQQIQATPTPSDYNIFHLDEQLKAENQSLRNRLRQNKDELARIKKQQLNQNPVEIDRLKEQLKLVIDQKESIQMKLAELSQKFKR